VVKFDLWKKHAQTLLGWVWTWNDRFTPPISRRKNNGAGRPKPEKGSETIIHINKASTKGKLSGGRNLTEEGNRN